MKDAEEVVRLAAEAILDGRNEWATPFGSRSFKWHELGAETQKLYLAESRKVLTALQKAGLLREDQIRRKR